MEGSNFKELCDLVDGVYCINLISRDDRYQHVKKIFDDHNIQVKFHRPEKDPEGGKAGCFRSHVAVIKDAYEKGFDNVLIFEDDIRIEKIPNYIINNIKIFLDRYRNDYNTLNLSYCPDGLKNIFNSKGIGIKGIYKTYSIGAQSYIVNRKYMEIVKNYDFDLIQDHIDGVYSKQIEMYSLYPSLITQGGFTTDNNSGKFYDDFFSNNKRIIMKFYENFAFNIWNFIFSLILIFTIYKRWK